MRHRVLAILLIALSAVAPGLARAAFQDIEVSPRLRALGEAGTAVALDAYAPLHNPALLAWSDDVSGAVSYLEPFSLPFSSQSAIAGSMPLPGGAGGLGFGIRKFGVRYMDVDMTDEMTLSIAHGFKLMHDAQSELAFGWSVSFYSLGYGRSVTGLDPGKATSLGLGLGAVATVRERTRVGFSIENANNPSIGDRDHEDLNRHVRGGLAYSPYPGVTTVLDMNAQLGSEIEYRGGIEFEAAKILWLRTGLATAPNKFTAGFGLNVHGIHLDYGYSSGGGVLDDTHHIGLEVHVRSPWEPRP